MAYINGIQPDLFRYRLTTSEVVNRVLEFSPRDWNDSSISVKKDFQEFFSNKREFSLPLGFVKEGRSLLADEFLKNGVSGLGLVYIDRLNAQTGQYELMYQGNIDFSKADLTAEFIEINFLDNDIQSRKEAFENTEYELEFTDEQSLQDFDAILPKIQMVENASYFIVNQGDGAAPNWSAWGFLPAMSLNENNVRLANVTFVEQARERKGSNNTDPTTYPTWNNNRFAQVSKQGLEIEINLDITYSGQNYISSGDVCGFSLSIYEIWYNASTETYSYTALPLINAIQEHGSGSFNNVHRVIKKSLITNRDNSILYLVLNPVDDRRPPENQQMSFTINEAVLSLQYKDETNEGSRAVSKTPFVIFRDLFRKITENPALEVKSDFLQSKSNILFTCGDAIRRLESAVLKTSFSRFWQSISSIWDLGFDIINGVPTIEEKSFFFNEEIQIADLGQVRSHRISAANELVFNDIRTGYEKQDYDTELGRQEINNGQTWVSPISSGKKTLNIVSDYRADAYGVNQIRERAFYNPNRNETETDDSTDDDIYIIYCELLPYFPPTEIIDNSSGSPVVTYLRQGLYAVTLEGLVYSGIEENKYFFNWMLSPKRNLINHSRFLAVCMYGEINQDKVLEMTRSDKWKNFNVTYKGESFYEETPIQISSLQGAYFMPFEVTIQAAFPEYFYQNYIQNPTGYISFVVNEQEYRMFIKEIEFDIAENSDFEVTGLLCPNQNLTDLFL